MALRYFLRQSSKILEDSEGPYLCDFKGLKSIDYSKNLQESFELVKNRTKNVLYLKGSHLCKKQNHSTLKLHVLAIRGKTNYLP